MVRLYQPVGPTTGENVLWLCVAGCNVSCGEIGNRYLDRETDNYKVERKSLEFLSAKYNNFSPQEPNITTFPHKSHCTMEMSPI